MKRKILIIEDEKNLAEIIGKTLTKENFETKIITEGDLALDNFYSFSPSLVLLDINLPKKMVGIFAKKFVNIQKFQLL